MCVGVCVFVLEVWVGFEMWWKEENYFMWNEEKNDDLAEYEIDNFKKRNPLRDVALELDMVCEGV